MKFAIALVVTAGWLLFVGYSVGAHYGYKAGQIAAINGNVKYVLVQHRDGTATWERRYDVEKEQKQ